MNKEKLKELYAMKAALEAQGFPEQDACRIVVSKTGHRLNDGEPVGSPTSVGDDSE